MLSFTQVVLDNGLCVLGEVNTAARSVALGFGVKTGSRDETKAESGLSHFLEHMVFKGTARRTYMDINREFDEIGARYNAFTSEENTFYHANVLPEYLERAVDLLADMLRPALRPEDFEAEKKVILEEIALYEDQPRLVAYEKALALHFGGHPLGNPVLGTRESIGAMTCDQMRDYFRRRYAPGNLIFGCAGRFDWDRLLELVVARCGSWPAGEADREVTPSVGTGRTQAVARPTATRQHLVLVSDAPAAEDRLRYAAGLVATAVGDVRGSRLYWELVDPGLADAADTDYSAFNGHGLWLTYLSCDPQRCEEVVRKTVRVFEEVTAKGLTEEELARAKSKVGSHLVLRSERPMGRLAPLVFNWQYRREYMTLEEDLGRLYQVSQAEVREVLRRYSLAFFTTVGVGPLTALPGVAY